MAALPQELKCQHCGLAVTAADAAVCGHCGRDVSFVNDAGPQDSHDSVTSQVADQLSLPEQIENATITTEQAPLQEKAATASAGEKRGIKTYFNLIKNVVALPVFWFATQYGADYLSRCCGHAAESITTGVVMFMALVGWAFFVIVT
jgi:hypothetical protein